MKHFLNKIFLFSILLLVLGLFVEYMLYLLPNEWSYKRDYIKKHADEISILLVGASNAANGIDPSAMGSGCFNLAVNGQLLCITKASCETYIPICSNLKTVILPISYRLLFQGYEYPLSKNDLIAQMEESEKCKYLKYMGVKEHTSDFIYWPELIWLKSESINRFFKTREENVICDSLGFERLSLNNRESTWKQVHIPDMIDDQLGNAERAFTNNVENVCRIAELCKLHEIRFILLATPYYETAQQVAKGVQRDYLIKFVDQVKSLYPEVEFIEYTFDNRFEEDDFYNSSHLNEIGAAKFAKILLRDIKI